MKSSQYLKIATTVLMVGCTNYDLGVISRYEVTPPTTGEDPSGPACYEMKFTQPEADRIKNVDLLFVVDTSGSLNEERAKIAEQIDAYVSKLPETSNIRIGVMLGHGSDSQWSGKLWSNNSASVVLDISTQGIASVRSQLVNRLKYSKDDPYSDGGETTFVSLYNGIHGDKLAASKAAGFFRDDAALAVILVSDENEICHVYPDGISRVADGERYQGKTLEQWAFDQYCSVVPTGETVAKNLDYKLMYSELKALKGQQPLLVAAMVYTNPNNFPRTGENEYGYGYVELVQESGGALVNLADPDYSAGLAFIGEMTAIRLNLVTDFLLTHTNVDETSIKVKVDDEVALYTYSAAANTVVVSEPGTAKSKVQINYCAKEVICAEDDLECSSSSIQ